MYTLQGKGTCVMQNLALYYNMAQHINLSPLWDKKY